MHKITLQDIENIQKHDRISVTYLNKDNEPVTKNTRFYGVENNTIIVYQPRKQKKAWEIEVGMECIIKKIGA